ncbi:sigma-70 family RNA polymerase sigma factor [Kolteria novifilia]
MTETEIEFVDNQDFRKRGAEAEILGAYPVATKPPRRRKPWTPPTDTGLGSYLVRLSDEDLLTKEQEVYLFRKLNYLKYRAECLRRKINVDRPKESALDAIDELLAESREVRGKLINANLRLVVSVAKKFIDPTNTLEELISEGNIALMRAVEKFDYSLGFKFSTYATRAIRNGVNLSSIQQTQRNRRYVTGGDQIFEVTQAADDWDSDDDQRLRDAHGTIVRLLDCLDPSIREVIVARFGLEAPGQAQTLEEIGNRLGVSRERVRQIQVRALRKLRKMAEEEQVEGSEGPPAQDS